MERRELMREEHVFIIGRTINDIIYDRLARSRGFLNGVPTFVMNQKTQTTTKKK